jgi:short-subunit dehydrogenase involved in D-alanine esterification of teichoic acids
MKTVLITGASSGIGEGLLNPSPPMATSSLPAGAIHRVLRHYNNSAPTSVCVFSI